MQLAVLVVPPVQLGGNFGTQEFFAGTPNDNDEAGGTPGDRRVVPAVGRRRRVLPRVHVAVGVVPEVIINGISATLADRHSTTTRYLGSFIFLLITTADLARLQGCSAAGVVDVAAVHGDGALEAAVRAHGRAVCVVARAHRVCPTYTSAGRPSSRGRARSRRCATSREDRVVARGCQRTRDRRRAARTDVEDDVAHAAAGGIDDAAVRRSATRTAP